MSTGGRGRLPTGGGTPAGGEEDASWREDVYWGGGGDAYGG